MRKADEKRILEGGMKLIAASMSEGGTMIKCPFHDDRGKRMKILEDRGFCPECGAFSAVQIMAAAGKTGIGEAEEELFSAWTGSPSGKTLRKLAEECRKSIHPEYGDRWGFVPEALSERFAGLKGMEGRVLLLDEGIWHPESGRTAGKPGLVIDENRTPFIALCESYEDAARKDEAGIDCAAGVSTEELAKTGKPVAVPSEEEARKAAEAGIRAGWIAKGENRMRWIRTAERKRSIAYREDGDAVNFFRSMSGCSMRKLEELDSRLFLTGEDVTVRAEDLLERPSPGCALSGEWRIVNERGAARQGKGPGMIANVPCAEKKAERKSKMLSLPAPERVPLRFDPIDRNQPAACIRFSSKDIISAAGGVVRARLGRSGLVLETGYGSVHSWKAGRRDWLYVMIGTPVRILEQSEERTREIHRPGDSPQDVPQLLDSRGARSFVRVIRPKEPVRKITFPKESVKTEGGRAVITLADKTTVSMPARFAEENGEEMNITVSGGIEFPLRDAEGRLTGKKAGASDLARASAYLSYAMTMRARRRRAIDAARKEENDDGLT